MQPAVGSPMFPDAPSLTLSAPSQSATSPAQPQSKLAVSKPSAAMQESLKRSLAQAHSQLAHAASADKSSAQPQATTATVQLGTGGPQNLAGSLGSAGADTQGYAAGPQAKQAQETSCLIHEPGKITALNTYSYPAAEPCMPQYGRNGSDPGCTELEFPDKSSDEKRKESSDQPTKAKVADDSIPSDPNLDARLWYASCNRTILICVSVHPCQQSQSERLYGMHRRR
jgi:hypothetical protein